MHELDRAEPMSALPHVDGTETRSQTASGAPATSLRASHALDITTILGLQRTAGNAGVVQLLAEDEERSPVHDVVGSGGQPLDAGTRDTMEAAFGDSFGDVRLHTDASASRSAQAVGANAYTVGSDIVFQAGRGPGTPTFQRDIAHELEHVRQQRSGPVDGADAPGGIRVSDPSDRFEQAASARAGEILAGLGPSSAAIATASTPGAPAVQRDVVEDEEEMPSLQGQWDDAEDQEEMPGGG